MTYATQIQRLQTRAERQLRRRLVAVLSRVTRSVAARVRAGEDPRGLEETLQGALRVVLEPVYRATALRAGRSVVERMEQRKSITEVFEETAEAWIASHVLERVTTISQGYFALVRTILDVAFQEGIGQEETARRIRKKVGQEYSQWRAARVARTEMSMAVNKGSDIAARSTGLEMVKEWSSADDARTRPSHARADGQVREMDEAFDVGDYRLQHPGDPAGPAGEVINCRCVVLYHPRVNGEILR